MLTKDNLKHFLSYDPATGLFTLFPRRGVTARVTPGTLGGGRCPCYSIGLDRNDYLVARVAWLYMTGAWPCGQIDHIDGNRLNNKFDNLRVATHEENLRNRGAQRNNTSGFKGVSWSKHTKKWVAQIKHDSCNQYLGLHATREAAHAVYAAAASLHHGEFARVK